jgi:hypothetical protein
MSSSEHAPPEGGGLKARTLTAIQKWRDKNKLQYHKNGPVSPAQFNQWVVGGRGEGEASREYEKIYRLWREAAEINELENRTDLAEKLRFLIFRAATGIAIAGIVLGTAYLAQRWGIQLPMVRP